MYIHPLQEPARSVKLVCQHWTYIYALALKVELMGPNLMLEKVTEELG